MQDQTAIDIRDLILKMRDDAARKIAASNSLVGVLANLGYSLDSNGELQPLEGDVPNALAATSVRVVAPEPIRGVGKVHGPATVQVIAPEPIRAVGKVHAPGVVSRPWTIKQMVTDEVRLAFPVSIKFKEIMAGLAERGSTASEPSVSSVVSRLCAEGAIEKISRGVYRYRPNHDADPPKGADDFSSHQVEGDNQHHAHQDPDHRLSPASEPVSGPGTSVVPDSPALN